MRATINKPPKGWNSFDSYGWSVNEDEFKEGVEFCDKHLKQFGYDIMTVDFCWSHPGADSRPNPDIADTAVELNMDCYGRLLPSEDRFPSAKDGNGFAPLAEFVHGKGMKFGIHIMRGIPKQAVDKKTQIKGTDLTAAAAADTDGLHCWWLDQMHPLDMTKNCAQAYLDSLFELYSAWGVDFVKVDDLSFPYSELEVEGYSKAIEKCGREIILSLSPGATPIEKWEHVSKYADMWRISPDFWDSFDSLKKNFDLFDSWSQHRVADTYPDGDMIPFGKLSLRGPMGDPRFSSFSYDEKISLMTMWCINSSPLILGGELSEMDEKTRDIVTNRLLLQVDNCAVEARKLSCNDDLLIWTAKDRFNKAVEYVALFNLSDDEMKTVDLDLEALGISGYYDNNDDNFSFVEAERFRTIIMPHGACCFAASVK
jgi:alpha-galactosidase